MVYYKERKAYLEIEKSATCGNVVPPFSKINQFISNLASRYLRVLAAIQENLIEI